MRTPRSMRWIPKVLAAAFALGSMASYAAETPRITAIDSSARIALANSVSPRVSAAADLGEAPSSTVLSDLSLRFSLTAEQQNELANLMATQQTPSSPEYHHWLTPEQFGARFGLANSDIQQVSTWLRSQGFTITRLARGGQFIQFSGTVAQAENAFGTSIHRVQVNGQTHLANVTAPSLPKSIAAVTEAITGLDDFSPKPQASLRKVAAPKGSGAIPQFTSPTSGNHYLAPGDIYTIYDEQSLLSSGTDGTGVTLAVVGQATVPMTALAAFRSAAGLSANLPTIKTYGASPINASSQDVYESVVDLEWAGAAAPGASVLFVTSNAVIDGSLTGAIDDDLAPVITVGYGDCEADLGVSNLIYYNQLLQQAAAEGITIIGSAGDSGATGCDLNTSTASHGLAVEFPASSPYVTGVGGTAFNEGSGVYWSATNGAYAGSATAYIPEVAWNDDAVAQSGGGTQLASTGGGASLYFAKPSWQTGADVPPDFSRDVPDLALAASYDHDGYLMCGEGECTNGFADASGYYYLAGGTEVTSSEFAGFMALVVQKHGRIGVANNTLYALANSGYANNVFHDVMSGTNASPCVAGSADCASGGPIGYTAKPGYDQTTGWGSVDAYYLVTDWGLVAPLTTTPAGTTASITNLSGNLSKVTAGTSISLTAIISSGVSSVISTPTGTVQFTVDGTAVGSAVTITGGAAAYTLDTTSLSPGGHIVQATYSGDATFAGSKATFALQIASSAVPDFTLTPATASATATSGGTAPGIIFTVTPINGFSGTVSFTAAASSNLQAQYAFSATSVQISGASAATTTLTLLAFQTAANSHGPLPNPPGASAWEGAGSGVLFAGMILWLSPRRRRLTALLGLFLAIGLTGLSGCSGHSGNTSPAPTQVNTPPGTYTVTVSVTGSVNGTSVTHTSIVNFVVQ